MSFGRYQFLSWARRGIASQISEKDTLGQSDGSAVERAQIPIKVSLNAGAPTVKNFTLFGPGDVTGIQQDMIIRTEPINGVGDFEPNLLPYVEFYDQDFPYRYTPASPAGSGITHLRPWLALIILKENEFLETKRREPLSSIKILSEGVLPPHNQLHLWCHMHSNLPHEETEFETFIDNLEEDVKTDPDGVYSRLLCPRKLEAKTLYHAFLVPSYETGRLAGLGQPTSEVKAQKPAWPGSDNEFPVYYRWYFRTGKNFDFEYLVKLLKPRVMDERVGVRPVDCSRPAFVRADADEEVRPPEPNVLLLEGAMKAPHAKSSVFPPPGVVQPFFEDVEKLVNLNRFQQENSNEDPYVSIPYYGMFHAMRLDNNNPGKKEIPPFVASASQWYNDLNRDPRNRIPAGYGKRVVQENQEKFMDRAWEQLQNVLEANRKMKLTRFTLELNQRLYQKTLLNEADEAYLAVTKPMSRRILFGQETVKTSMDNSLVANATFQAAFRRITRDNTSIIKGLTQQSQQATYSYATLFQKVNRVNGLSGQVEVNFEPIPQLKKLTTFTPPTSIKDISVWSTKSNLQNDYLYNMPGYTGGMPKVDKWKSLFKTTTVFPIIGRLTTPLIPLSRTRIDSPLSLSTASVTRIPSVTTTIADTILTTDKHTLAAKQAYNDVSRRFSYEEKIEQAPTLAVSGVKQQIDTAITPKNSYRRLIGAKIAWPVGMLKNPVEQLLPAMAYPDIPDSMYKYLLEIDKEFLLPNLNLIENNTLSLLKTNQKFIESYLVGLNDEMGRELLWREYATDMRGSYFRQFWDVSGFVTPDTTPKDADALKDIRPIHTWFSSSELGDHNARDPEGDPDQLVFVVRGDLLKKFPNTVIYAQKALKEDDKKVIRRDMNEQQYEKEVRFPLYQAEIAPDIKLLGFNLTIEEASGEEATPGFNDNDNLGWFFILAEVPGEPRFGMDITFNPNEPDIHTWNDLSWENLPENVDFVRSEINPNLNLASGIDEQWGRSASDMASILMQRPVMVAIHATEMLQREIPVNVALTEFTTLFQYVAQLKNP
ncbi:hypothetical protein NC796_12065 [Aliifodinibius sp. S!AR15-10]|uniref:hypothetical protein n=1 Tax=Aliifodinibius sp. S!AR15-10 TaxID=2950437 RepID=UPI00285C5954|nr:hypothetical protein [Aliifodinibius sp. S!AR15-10]MDR8391884.1 hypothetical protein [Aliifodinibius sp. S!AR15-10]